MFVNRELRVISLVGAPKLPVDGAKLGQSAMADVDEWPESPGVKSVTELI